MIYVVICFLWVSLYLYLILGGADFGVGILEIFTGKKYRKKVQNTSYTSMGPIWEANHMWLIIAIVILFVGFPIIYSTLSIYLHIPLVLMLFGIIARGTAFVFRNYDAVEDDWQTVYDRIFRISSFVTPFFLGLIAASTVSATIDTSATDFLSGYIYGWLTPFGVSVGIFTLSISAYLASIYIIGEASGADFIAYLIKQSKIYFFAVFFAGVLVFITAYYQQIPLLTWIFEGYIGRIAIAMACLSIVVLFWAYKYVKSNVLRICAAFQIFMILVAATYSHFPNLILLAGNKTLSLIEHAGSENTIKQLANALLLGSVFILPFFGYLLYSFHRNHTKKTL